MVPCLYIDSFLCCWETVNACCLEGKGGHRNPTVFPATRGVKEAKRKMPIVSHPQDALETPGRRAKLCQRLLSVQIIPIQKKDLNAFPGEQRLLMTTFQDDFISLETKDRLKFEFN